MGVVAGFTFGLVVGLLPTIKAIFLVLAALLAVLVSVATALYGVSIVALICVILALNLGLVAGSLCLPDDV